MWKLIKMDNDSYFDLSLASQTTKSEHYCIVWKCCCPNLEVFMPLDALPIQLIAQATPDHILAAAWSIWWSDGKSRTELSRFK